MHVCWRRLEGKRYNAVKEPVAVLRGHGGENDRRSSEVVRLVEEMRDALFDALVRLDLRHAETSEGEGWGTGCG